MLTSFIIMITFLNYLLYKSAIFFTFFILFNTLQRSVKLFMNLICISWVCLSAVRHFANSHNYLRLLYNLFMFLKYNMACSIIKIKCVVFILRIQAHAKEFRCIIMHMEKTFSYFQWFYNILNILKFIYICIYHQVAEEFDYWIGWA